MSFNITQLAGNKVLVDGTDFRGTPGETILDGTGFAQLQEQERLRNAHEEFDASVDEFFAPLLEAAEKLEAKHEVVLDPLTNIVLDEGSEGETRRSATIVELDTDTAILRAIDSGNTDRLVWVKDELVLTAYVPAKVEDEVDGPATGEVHTPSDLV